MQNAATPDSAPTHSKASADSTEANATASSKSASTLPPEMARILIIDDEPAIRRALTESLEYEKYQVESAVDGKAGLKRILDESFDVVMLDIKMPKMDGMEVLEKAIKEQPDLPIIMISGHGTLETAVEAVKKGAFDYIDKPLDLNRVLITIRNALEKSDLVTETKVLKRKVTKTHDIIGESQGIAKIKETIERVAPTDARVLITGANGTGKELVARWLQPWYCQAALP